MLMGEFHHNVDDKQRLIIPSKLRDDLGDKVIVTRGLENSLFIYSEISWNKIMNKLNTLPFTNKDARNFNRFFLSGATICEFDKQGRIKLNSSLMEFASITKECVIVGVLDRLEVWSLDKWNAFFENNHRDLSDLADHLFDTNFDM